MSCFSLFFKRSRTTQQQSDPSNEDFPGAENITRYSYKELAKATLNFDQSNRLVREVLDLYTRGYLAPEYATRGQVTFKSDVYIFGVLVEIVSGRCNTDTKLPYEDQILLEKTWKYYDPGHLEKIIDGSMSNDVDVNEACRFLKVVLLCT